MLCCSSDSILGSNFKSNEVAFGYFNARIPRPDHRVIGKRFSGSTYSTLLWNQIPDLKLEQILDFWQAGYSNEIIQSVLAISSLPTKSFIYNKLNICNLCGRSGHLSGNSTNSTLIASSPSSPTQNDVLSTLLKDTG